MASSETTSFTLSPELRRTSGVVVLGSIMSILDTTIVAVALATLGQDFHVSVTTIQWVSTGYLLALSIVIPVTGWAVDRFGAKLVWMTSLSLFIAGSCLCGVAWSANSLIAFRVLQGIGGGMLLPVGQSILARAAGPQRMGRVMSIIGVPMVLGPILGPVIGGLIVSNFSWRWIFYINLPIGIVTLILSSRWLPKWDTDERFPASFDTLGFCLLSPGLAALVFSLAEVGTTGSFTSTSVLISFVLGVVLMAGFIVHALHIKNPLLELHLFKDRSYSIANICIFMLGFTLFGSMFLLPLYYQIARGQEAWVAGLLMAPAGHRRRLHHALGRQRDRPGGAAPHRAVRHPPHGGGNDPVRLRHHLHQRGVARRHALRPRPRPRPDDDAHDRGGLLRSHPRRDSQSEHDHEHRAPSRRFRRHRPLRRGARAPDRDATGTGGRQGGRKHRRDLFHGGAAPTGRRSGRSSVRPHVLVGHRGHRARLHPDPVPAQPCAGGSGVARRGCGAASVDAGDTGTGTHVAGAMLD